MKLSSYLVAFTGMLWTGFARPARQIVISEILQDAVQILLIGDAVVVEVEHARLVPKSMHPDEVLLVDHFVQIAVAITGRFGVQDGIEGNVQLRAILPLFTRKIAWWIQEVI